MLSSREILPVNITDVNEKVLHLWLDSFNEDYLESNLLSFTWIAKEITDNRLTIQLVWDNPTYVSQH